MFGLYLSFSGAIVPIWYEVYVKLNYMWQFLTSGLEDILKFTRQPGGQSDMVWRYSGLQI